jgi:glycosyltransferase involved in cell wall biosynthesis
MSGHVIAVNGRFLTMSVTGVQRYAHEILRRMSASLDSELRILVPPDLVLEGEDPELGDIDTNLRWHGVDGHRWEQLVLPRLVRKVGAQVLWSPCSWGPLTVRGHVPVIHDIAPLTLPEQFTPLYRLFARAVTGPLIRRAALVATPSTRVRRELLDQFSIEPGRVQLVAPGVGEPFTSAPIDDLGCREAGYCLLVGAHVSRKNAAFLLDLWPSIRASTGLELHLTYRRIVTTRRLQSLERASASGVVLHADPSDEQLVRLYADALCLVWPSYYEGYGFPLLEAMAVGTPFLSTDVGASAELAVRPEEQILPLDPSRWIEQLEAWNAADISDLRRASAARARAQTWDEAASHTARILERVAARDS